MQAEFDQKTYDQLAAEFRYIITDIICRAGSGHLGGALSLVETVISLYWRVMNVRPEEPRWEERDRLVLSKGHAGPVIYTALAYKGYFPKNWLPTLNQNGTRLPSHMDMNLTPGVDMTAGSLGQGISCACGVAMAAKLDKKSYKTFCIIGDGESNEGQVWEAALFAAHQKLDNLIGILDYNKLQIDGFTHEVLGLEPVADKWRSFGWEVLEMDGHDWQDIYKKLMAAKQVVGKPVMIIAHTIKGKEMSSVENTPGSHNIKAPKPEDREKWLSELKHNNIKLPY